jgi:isopentenyl-diphosphate delta-isomerase, type 1
METEQLVLVNNRDEPVGTMGKMEVHQKGLLHRAFSVFVFDRTGRFLLQQRAFSKYHSSGLWTNTCCSHPRPDENVLEAAKRRLKEEMGFETDLKEIFSFVYKAEMENGLIEHEYDHVFAGFFNDVPQPNGQEVQGWCYSSIKDLKEKIARNPNQFTSWFRIVFPKIEEWWNVNYKNNQSWSY